MEKAGDRRVFTFSCFLFLWMWCDVSDLTQMFFLVKNELILMTKGQGHRDLTYVPFDIAMIGIRNVLHLIHIHKLNRTWVWTESSVNDTSCLYSQGKTKRNPVFSNLLYSLLVPSNSFSTATVHGTCSVSVSENSKTKDCWKKSGAWWDNSLTNQQSAPGTRYQVLTICQQDTDDQTVYTTLYSLGTTDGGKKVPPMWCVEQSKRLCICFCPC